MTRKKPAATLERCSPEELRVMVIGRSRCYDLLELWIRLQWQVDLDPPPSRNPDILMLLASCYLQGVRDAAEVAVRIRAEGGDD